MSEPTGGQETHALRSRATFTGTAYVRRPRAEQGTQPQATEVFGAMNVASWYEPLLQ